MRVQALVDDISAAAYNVIFTSLPILFFAVLDRPLRHHKTMLRFPQARAPLLLAGMFFGCWVR